jgi:hypothetical protein
MHTIRKRPGTRMDRSGSSRAQGSSHRLERQAARAFAASSSNSAGP